MQGESGAPIVLLLQPGGGWGVPLCVHVLVRVCVCAPAPDHTCGARIPNPTTPGPGVGAPEQSLTPSCPGGIGDVLQFSCTFTVSRFYVEACLHSMSAGITATCISKVGGWAMLLISVVSVLMVSKGPLLFINFFP